MRIIDRFDVKQRVIVGIGVERLKPSVRPGDFLNARSKIVLAHSFRPDKRHAVSVAKRVSETAIGGEAFGNREQQSAACRDERPPWRKPRARAFGLIAADFKTAIVGRQRGARQSPRAFRSMIHGRPARRFMFIDDEFDQRAIGRGAGEQFQSKRHGRIVVLDLGRACR